MSRPFDVAVIGGGLSATALACVLAEQACRAHRIAFFNRGDLGPGTAYAPQSASLLMNGPVRAMSAVPGDDRHLARYLVNEADDALICRARYGAYLRATGANALAQHPRMTHERAEIVDIERTSLGYRLTDDVGRRYDARAVVLAIGNLPPNESFLPESVRRHPGYAGDPWTADIAHFDPAAEVIVIGSRLTAMDTIALLDECAFRGRVHIVSRHALLPLVEDASIRGVDPATLELDTRTPYTMLRSLRRAVADFPGDWRAVMESLRSITPAIWNAWHDRDRKRFLRHAQSMWAIHRYRVPPATYAAFVRMNDEGRVTLHRGRIRGGRADARGITLQLATPEGPLELHAAYVVNCTGPNADLRTVTHPFVRSALAHGVMRADPFALGVETTSDYRVLDGNGEAQPRLFAIGPLLRGRWYETTAVNEIRLHATAVARLLQIALDPAGPTAIDVELADGIARKVS
ncbi:MAG TPA: FAD/NAD(P)-binding protein [Candidatus Aquilonibacter sp.]